MQTLLHEGIPIVFLSAYGRYHGALTPQVSRNSLLRSAQHRVANNPMQCLSLSKAFVQGKLANMRTMLQRRKWQATDKTDAVLEPLLTNIKTMQAMEKRVSTAKVSKKGLTSSRILCKIDKEIGSVSERRPKNLGPSQKGGKPDESCFEPSPYIFPVCLRLPKPVARGIATD